MKTIIALLSKYREIITYLIFGFLTTAVNLLVFGLFLRIFHISANSQNDFLVLIANTFAWIAAVLFAFVTNKLFVFQSKSKEKRTVIRELISFVSVRLLTFGIETGMMYLGLRIYVWLSLSVRTDFWNWGVKFAISFIVITLNYIFSKLFIFKKENS